MRKKFIQESQYVEREYRWHWWWPFWVYHTTHYRVRPDNLRASRGFTEIKRPPPPLHRPSVQRRANSSASSSDSGGGSTGGD